MKKLLLLTLLFPVIVIGQEEIIIDNDDTVLIEELKVLKSDSTLATGKVKWWHENGKLKQEETFVDGKPEGVFKEWHENGRLKQELTFKNGLPEGLAKEWYENGRLKQEATIKDGKAEGLAKQWYENGQLSQEMIFKNNLPTGLVRLWHENGQLIQESTNNKDGKKDGLFREWYENGQIKQEYTLMEGFPEGVTRVWHKNGQLRNEKHFKDGAPEGLDKQWSENGKLKVKTIWKKNSNEGVSEEYYENGQLKSKGVCIHDIDKDDKGYKKNGVWEEYNEQGKLKAKAFYRFGIKVKTEKTIKENLPQTTTCYVEGEIPTLINTFNYSGHKYQYMEMNVSWDIAKKLAEEEGGYLAVFETLEEIEHVIAARVKKVTYWVGLSDSEKEGSWTWINGTALDKNMEGYLEKGNDLKNRDYAHTMRQGGLMSRQISGGLPVGYRGEMCVSGYLVEFDSID